MATSKKVMKKAPVKKSKSSSAAKGYKKPVAAKKVSAKKPVSKKKK